MKPTFNKTKIIATVGPSISTKEKLLDLVVAGVDVFRLNFSHGNHQEYKEIIQHIRSINAKYSQSIAILQDLQGPKIRIGEVENGEVKIEKGDLFTITVDPSFGIGNAEKVTMNYKEIIQDIKVGDIIFIDDGNIRLQVEEVGQQEIKTRIVTGGFLKSKKGINLPNTQIKGPILGEKDLKDLEFGLKHNVDWVALSFVRSPIDIINLKKKIKNMHTKIIAKIERKEAIENIEEIIEVSDAIMIARGDLGIEIEMQEVPRQQKRIIRMCNLNAKPVIVATHMMESMRKNYRPTRAEVNDVSNAIMDGTDAVMLSAETSTGDYPLEVINTMVSIVQAAEKDESIYNRYYKYTEREDDYPNKMVIQSACRIGRNIKAKSILGLTTTGFTAFRIACHRPTSDIFIFTNNKRLVNTLNLIWGVRSFFFAEYESLEEIFTYLENFLKSKNLLKKGDRYISTACSPLRSGRTNLIKLNKVN